MKAAALLTFLLSLLPSAMLAQTNFFHSWEDRVRATYASQPAWPVPVVTPSSGLVQLIRGDIVRQYTPTHTLTWIYGNGKGVDLIAFARTEVDINLPPLIQHNNSKVKDGAGDFSVVMKYRPFAGNAHHGTYSTAVQLAISVPTGSYKNGVAVSTLAPTVFGGKGFGRFDVQTALGATLPNSSVSTVGRTITWNTAAQYKVNKYLWPELEVNSSYFHLGPNNGKNQTFLTPGLIVSNMKLRADPKNRLAFVLGAGMQIATSPYHAYNHGLVLTGRMTF